MKKNHTTTKTSIPYVKACTLDDIRYIHAHLRDADSLELRLVYGNDDLWNLEYTYYLALFAWTVHFCDKPVCVFGVSCLSPFSKIGVPWLVATDDLVKVRLAFLRQCRGYVAKMHGVFPHLENYVHTENTVSCAWLGWMGFRLEVAAPYGVKGGLFHRFYKMS